MDKAKDETNALTETTHKLKIKKVGVHALAPDTVQQRPDPNEASERICLLVDCSSSMVTRFIAKDDSAINNEPTLPTIKSRIDYLKDAVADFIKKTNFNTTALALRSFPPTEGQPSYLSQDSTFIWMHTQILAASGGTPLWTELISTLRELSLTRIIIISDGEATDAPTEGRTVYLWDDLAKKDYNIVREADVPCDCIFIGDDVHGESTLKHISKITGGIFLRFTDVAKFSKALAFLTPEHRELLLNPSFAEILGADK